MRVTKKLSSTHAIGKCVFKLRGSLTNDERQALDAARRAFLASFWTKRLLHFIIICKKKIKIYIEEHNY